MILHKNAVFRGSKAPASLKPGAAAAPAADSFQVFRGSKAPASLKPDAADSSVFEIESFPGLQSPGLIEATRPVHSIKQA